MGTPPRLLADTGLPHPRDLQHFSWVRRSPRVGLGGDLLHLPQALQERWVGLRAAPAAPASGGPEGGLGVPLPMLPAEKLRPSGPGLPPGHTEMARLV